MSQYVQWRTEDGGYTILMEGGPGLINEMCNPIYYPGGTGVNSKKKLSVSVL